MVLPKFPRQFSAQFVRSLPLQPLTLCLLLGNLGGVGLSLASPASAQSLPPVEAANRPHSRILSVSGIAQERIPTTLTQVSLGISAQGKTAQEVQQEMARRSTAVIALLRSRNVQRLETTGVNLSPNYTTSDNGRQKLIGYTGSNTVNFRLPTEQMGNLLDAAVAEGASNINGVSFVASEEAIAAARQRALRRAALEAQSQAQTVLAALGLPPGQAVTIMIDQVRDPMPPPMPLSRAQGIAGADAIQTRLEVIGGEQQVQATVTLRISY
jgi:uncharacterized protein